MSEELEEKKDDETETQSLLSNVSSQLEKCRKAIDDLRKKVREKRNNSSNHLKNSKNKNSNSTNSGNMQLRRKYRGHYGKIYDVDWSLKTSELFASVANDNHVIVWDSYTCDKVGIVELSVPWILSCAFNPTDDSIIACGGLNNTIEIYDINKLLTGGDDDFLINNYKSQLQYGHTGYVSHLKWKNDKQLYTSSGDTSIKLWDVEKETLVSSYYGHDGDILHFDTYSNANYNNRSKNGNLFISGSIDASIRVWDTRKKKACVKKLSQHQSDVNCVRFLEQDKSFVSGSDDATMLLWDIGTGKIFNEYKHDELVESITILDFSIGNRIIFAGYDSDPMCVGWDTVKAQRLFNLEHEARVTSLKTHPNGYCLLSAGWDYCARAWF